MVCMFAAVRLTQRNKDLNDDSLNKLAIRKKKKKSFIGRIKTTDSLSKNENDNRFFL